MEVPLESLAKADHAGHVASKHQHDVGVRLARSCPEEPVVRLTVIIEWENVLLAEAERCRRMLHELGTQLIDLHKGHSELSNQLGQIYFPIEILIMFDPNDVDQASVQGTVDRHLVGDAAIRTCRFVPVLGGTYYVLKNEGARQASGDLLVMLDTDVVPQPGWLRALLQPFADRQIHL